MKNAVLEAVNRLFELVQESERDQMPFTPVLVPVPAPAADHRPHPSPNEVLAGQAELLKSLKEHISEIKENSSKLNQLRDSLAFRDSVEGATYASVASASISQTGAKALERVTLHSVEVYTGDGHRGRDTGEGP